MRGSSTTVVFAGLMLVIGALPALVLGATPTVHTVCPSGDCDFTSIQDAIDAASAGDTVRIFPGTYNEVLHIETPDLTVEGNAAANTAGILVDGTGFDGNRGITAQASGLTLRNLTVDGPDGSSSDFGIKVESTTGDHITGITLENLVATDAGGSEVDLHGLDGVVVRNVTATGAGTAGVGLAITDSRNLLVDQLSTSGNAWGGMALFTSTFMDDPGIEGLTLTAAHSFGEINGLYMQAHSVPIDLDDLDLARIDAQATYDSDPSFRFLFEDVEEAINDVPIISQDSRLDPETGTIMELSTDNLHVAEPFSIQTALDDAAAGDRVIVHGGTYEAQLTIGTSVDVVGLDDPVVQAPANLAPDADGRPNLVTVSGDGVEVKIAGFVIQGPGPGACGSIHGGITVRDGAHAEIIGNEILEIRDDPISECQNGVGVTVGRTWYDETSSTATAVVTDNVFEGFQKSAVTVTGDGSHARIVLNEMRCAGHDVDFTIAQDAVQLWQSGSADIENNRIHDCLADFPDPRGSGIHLNNGAHDVLIQGNTMTGHGAAVAVLNFASWAAGPDAPVENVTIRDNRLTDNRGAFFNARDPGEGIAIHFNVIEGNEFGAVNFGDGPIDMTHNWWGSPLGPNATDNPLNITGQTGDRVIGPATTLPFCAIEACTPNSIVHGLGAHDVVTARPPSANPQG